LFATVAMTRRFENSHGKRAKACAEEMEQQSQEFCRSFDLAANQMSREYFLLNPKFSNALENI